MLPSSQQSLFTLFVRWQLFNYNSDPITEGIVTNYWLISDGFCNDDKLLHFKALCKQTHAVPTSLQYTFRDAKWHFVWWVLYRQKSTMAQKCIIQPTGRYWVSRLHLISICVNCPIARPALYNSLHCFSLINLMLSPTSILLYALEDMIFSTRRITSSI